MPGGKGYRKTEGSTPRWDRSAHGLGGFRSQVNVKFNFWFLHLHVVLLNLSHNALNSVGR